MTGMAARPLTLAEWAYLDAHRSAHLATIDPRGRPHLVPICFAADGEAIYSALDEKPKRVRPERLQRVANLIRHPEVTVLVDDYAEDWTQLRYLMIRGQATLLGPEAPLHAHGIDLLRAKYPQYGIMAIDLHPIIQIVPLERHAWSWRGEPLARDARHLPRFLDVAAIIQGRRSVRAFRPDPVPRELVEQILEAARWAPSPHGSQPWRFAIVTRPEIKQRLAAAMGDEWERQLAMDGEPPEIIARRKLRSHQRILEAPVCLVLCLYLADLDRYPDPAREQAETTMAIQSLGAAAQNALLRAYHLGLDGGWMCAPLFCPDTVREALGLGEELIPQALLTIGYAAKEPARRPRRTLADLIVTDT